MLGYFVTAEVVLSAASLTLATLVRGHRVKRRTKLNWVALTLLVAVLSACSPGRSKPTSSPTVPLIKISNLCEKAADELGGQATELLFNRQMAYSPFSQTISQNIAFKGSESNSKPADFDNQIIELTPEPQSFQAGGVITWTWGKDIEPIGGHYNIGLSGQTANQPTLKSERKDIGPTTTRIDIGGSHEVFGLRLCGKLKTKATK